MSRARTVLAAAALAALAACSSGTSGGGPGTLKVQFLTSLPAGADGAVMFVLSGPTVPTNVAAAAGDTLWTGQPGATVDTIVVTGPLANGTILTIDVPDVNLKGQYIGQVLQVAASGNYALRSLVNYNINVVQ